MSYKYIIESDVLGVKNEYEYVDERIIDEEFIEEIVENILDDSYIREEAYSNYKVIPQGFFDISDVKEKLKIAAMEYIDNIGKEIELKILQADKMIERKTDIKSIIQRYVLRDMDYGEFDAIISTYVEDSLVEFQKQGKWEMQCLDNEYILRYGVEDSHWCIDTREFTDLDFWFEEDTWGQMERIGFASDDSFLIWYTAECGCSGIDMEKIRNSCPIEFCEDDNKDSIIKKIVHYLSIT